MLDEMPNNHSLGMLTRDRGTTAANGRRYGGVALVYRLRTTKFTVFPLTNPNKYEVLAAIGKVQGVRGKIFTISCEAPKYFLYNYLIMAGLIFLGKVNNIRLYVYMYLLIWRQQWLGV